MYSKKKLIDILINIDGIDLINDSRLGIILKMNSRLAYRYALCTQSYYVTHEYNQLYIKKMLATFNHRNYLLEDGLFNIDNKSSEISKILTEIFINKNKNIFKEDKYIILYEKSSNSKYLKEIYHKINNYSFNSNNYLITFVNPSGSEWEQFYEFIISEYYIKKGYITDTQVPWDRQGSTPDVSIVKHPITKIIGNFMLSELSFIKYFLKEKINLDLINEDFYTSIEVIEVKTFDKKSQLNKYKNSEIANFYYEFLANADLSHKKNDDGLIYIKNNHPYIIKGNENIINNKKSNFDKLWFNIYLKIHLLGNFSIEEITRLLKEHTSKKNLTSKTIIDLSKKISFKEIFTNINYGL